MKAVIGLLAAICVAQAGLATDETGQTQLLEMRVRMGRALKSLPNYLCLQTTERRRASKSKAKSKALDSVELDVAHVGDKEMYSWPGRNLFADSQLQTVVPYGLVGTGAYASQVIDILFGPKTQFHYVGKVMLGELATLRWDFTVPRADSGWTVGNAKRSALVGSEGSLWADAETLAVVRLAVHATQFPARFPLKSVTRTIDYASVRIGARDVLLPSAVEDLVEESGGPLNINLSRFGRCREYSTSSTLTFDVPAAAAAQEQFGVSPVTTPPIAQIPPVPAAFPSNVQLVLGLDSHLSPGNAVIGMAVNAHLLSEVRHLGKLLAPKGTPVYGVLQQYAKHTDGFTYTYTLTIDFNELILPGGSVPFRALLKTIDTPVEGLDWLVPEEASAIQPAHYGAAVLIIRRQPSFHLYPGTRMIWISSDGKAK